MISVVIPAYNEEKNIAACLESLVHQTFSEPFEVIVVDNASTDKTSEVAQMFSQKINLRVVREDKKGRGAARWRGFEEAQGEIILSTDADCAVPENWIATMVQALRESQSVAVTGNFTVHGLSKYKSFLFTAIQTISATFYKLYFGHWWLNGFNFGIYNEAYKKAGGFDADLNAQEDIDLSIKVHNLGAIVRVSRSKVLFSGRRFEKGVFKGLRPYLQSFFTYYRKEKAGVYLDDPR
jgi:glycosyltransferase involved in cell wall biosynthesis